MFLRKGGIYLIKKKRFRLVFKIFAFVLIVVALYSVYKLALPNHVFFWETQGRVEVHNEYLDISKEFSQEDSVFLKNMLVGNWCYYDNPACGGFSEEAYIQYGSKKFMLGYDKCGTIKIEEKYFSIKDEDKEKFFKILSENGVEFPLS